MKPFDGVDKWHAILASVLILFNGLGVKVTIDPNGLLAQLFQARATLNQPAPVYAPSDSAPVSRIPSKKQAMAAALGVPPDSVNDALAMVSARGHK